MKKIVDEVKKEYGAEIKKIGNNYYVYRGSSIYDREKRGQRRYRENI